MKISVIVPTHNNEDTISECLDSIYETKYKNFEVVVVDDCSTDNTPNLLKKYPCKVIRLEKNSGASVARNIGAKNATGELLYFIDSDIVQKTDNLSMISKIQKQNPDIDIFNVTYHWKSMNKGLGPEFMAIKYYYDYDLLLRKNIHKIKSSWFQALGGVIPKKIFLESGEFFNEKIRLGGEEYELGYRLNSLGYKIYTFLDMELYHFWWDFRKRIRLNYKRSQYWLPVFLKRRRFETKGGVATKKNAVNALLLTLTAALFLISIFVNIIYIPLALLLIYFICNFDFYRYVYRKKKKMGFLFLSICMDIVLWLSIGAGMTAGMIKQAFNRKPY